jgi:hypothetical protein
MKKISILLSLMLFLAGCAESLALLGPATGASNGRIVQSSLKEAVSYGIKKGTGKSPLEHALAYAKEKNPKKKKEPCLSFIDKTNSEICAIIKKKISSTQANIKEKVQVIIEKTAITKKVVVEEKIIDSKDIFVEEEQKETNNIIKSRKSPRELAIAIQFAMKERSKIKYLDQ